MSVKDYTWDEMWRHSDDTFTEDITQWDLFDMIKMDRIHDLFEGCGKNVLECGSGTARASLYLARKGFKATMLDISEEALRVARNNFLREGFEGVFIKGDVEAMDFKDNTFDIVMSHGLLEHFEDIGPAVCEMTRVLKPGGLFFADLATKRFSIQTIGDLITLFLKVSYHLMTFKFSKIKRDFKIFRPDFYENSLSIHDYKKTMEHEGLINVVIVGDRPFPAISMPRKIERIYIKCLCKMMFFWDIFDRSKYAHLFGAGWWAYGIKGKK